VAGYWHGILFVPRHSRPRLLDLLAGCRKATNFHHPVSLKRVGKTTGPLYRCVNSWLHVGIAAMIQDLKGKRYPVFTGEQGQSPGFSWLSKVIGARFALFRVKDGHESLSGYPDYAAKVETTFRMGLKGALTIFFRSGDEVTIRSLHFDGHEHYHRNVDDHRIFRRMGALPPGVQIPDDLEIDDRTSDHRDQHSQSPDDCQFIQLADILVGGFRTVLGESKCEAQRVLCEPLRKLSDRWHQGAKRMTNSKWHRGFCISECYLRDGQWQFDSLEPEVPRHPELFDPGTW
jgi:hypothetical protein